MSFSKRWLAMSLTTMSLTTSATALSCLTAIGCGALSSDDSSSPAHLDAGVELDASTRSDEDTMNPVAPVGSGPGGSCVPGSQRICREPGAPGTCLVGLQFCTEAQGWTQCFIEATQPVPPEGCTPSTDPTFPEPGSSGVPIPSPPASVPEPPFVIPPDALVPNNTNCGDGILGPGESCDDGNSVSGDGCDEYCAVIEPGFVCPNLDLPCELVSFCGNGAQEAAERCDDGNTVSGDGCTALCVPELGWSCPDPGEPCIYTVVCGDAFLVSGIEECDDGNMSSGDGCSPECIFEPGYRCGDGSVVGDEECDDGGNVPGDGCSPSCKFEIGFACDASGCRPTTCGDGVAEGGEPCDDGNNKDLGDGCSPGCFLEPSCSDTNGPCTSTCGDGILTVADAEECDDGNRRNNDGCSDTCTLEPGFSCSLVTNDSRGTMALPIVYRDFYGIGSDQGLVPVNPDGHPDFENEAFSLNTNLVTITSSSGVVIDDVAAPTSGLVNTELGAGQSGVLSRKPSYRSAGVPTQLTGATRFAEWFRDVPGVNVSLVDQLTLAAGAQLGTFAYDTNAFYPLDGLGLNSANSQAPGPEPSRPPDWLGQGCTLRSPNGSEDSVNGSTHNYSFTSELRFWFQYQGGEQIVFEGDDDVWVFINRQLVIDLGGLHDEYGGDVCGNVWSALESRPSCSGLNNATTNVEGAPLNLQSDRIYEVAIFQAERHTCHSNFALRLENFRRDHSECEADCGDGVVAGDEACDDGDRNGAGHGFCSPDCTLGPRCGDGIVDINDGEECDNGVNLDRYFTTATACTPGCVFPSYCGDGVVDVAFAEQCDLGVEGNTGSYDGCSADCVFGPRCGDGRLDTDFEECDDGNRSNNDGCSSICTREPLVIYR